MHPRFTLAFDRRAGGWRGDVRAFDPRVQQRAATESNSAQMAGVTEDKNRPDGWVLLEPARQGGNFCKRSEAPWKNVSDLDARPFKKNKIVPLRRRNVLRDLQEVEWNWQGHLGEAPDFDPAHAEENSWRELLAKEFKGVALTLHSSRKHKDEIGRSRLINKREPAADGRDESPGWSGLSHRPHINLFAGDMR